MGKREENGRKPAAPAKDDRTKAATTAKEDPAQGAEPTPLVCGPDGKWVPKEKTIGF